MTVRLKLSTRTGLTVGKEHLWLLLTRGNRNRALRRARGIPRIDDRLVKPLSWHTGETVSVRLGAYERVSSQSGDGGGAAARGDTAGEGGRDHDSGRVVPGPEDRRGARGRRGAVRDAPAGPAGGRAAEILGRTFVEKRRSILGGGRVVAGASY
jgi:hypothetical protein